MTVTTGGWRVAARLARREVRRRPGRSALVAALVAVPVAGMLVGVAYQRTDELSTAESWRLQYGAADAVVHGQPGLPPTQPMPAGGRWVDIASTYRVAVAESGLCRCTISDVPVADPLIEGMVDITSGRAPRSAGEVLLSPDASSALGVGIGERLELLRPVAVEARVVGIGRVAAGTGEPVLLLGPGTGLAVDPMSSMVERLVDLPEGMSDDEIRTWESTAGPHAMSPAYPSAASPWIRGDNQNVEVRWTWVAGAVGLTVLGIVIVAAFAAGARRQLVTLGQLAANGATPRGLRRMLLLQGTFTGLVGTAAGLALGAAVLAALRSRTDLIFDHAVSHWEVRLLDVLPIVGLAVVAATVAAMVPAFGASRVSVLTALAGRRPLGRVSARHTATGLVVAATGLGMLGSVVWAQRDGLESGEGGPLSVVAVAGVVLLLLGVCAAAPAYVSILRPLAARLRGPWRLAARSLFRQRTRTSALVAAICAISAVAVAAGSIGLAAERSARDRRLLEQLPPDVVRVRIDHWLADLVQGVPDGEALTGAGERAELLLPEAERWTLSTVVVPGASTVPHVFVRRFVPTGGGEPEGEVVGSWRRRATIADEGFREAFDVDADVARALDGDGAVVLGEDDGRATVEAVTFELPDPAVISGSAPPTPQATVTFTAPVLGPEHADGFGAGGQVLLTPERAEQLGFAATPAEVVLRSPQPLTADQRHEVGQLALTVDAVEEEAQTAQPVGTPGPPDVTIEYEEPAFRPGPAFLEAVPAAVALLFTLFVVAAGLALAAAESRDERDVLMVLGASPPALRRTSAYKLLLLTLLGGALAVPVGLAPIVVWTRLDLDSGAAAVPWRTIGLLVVAIPLATAAVAALGSRLVRPRPQLEAFSRG